MGQQRKAPGSDGHKPSEQQDLTARRESFISAMRKATSTVCVVTTSGPGGRYGVTVSAMTSVTADPPAVLVCVNNGNFVIPAVMENRSFCVNLLGEGQKDVSEVFAGRHSPGTVDRFTCAEWTSLVTGSPVLVGAAAVLDCRLAQHHRFGSHTLFIGTVEGVDLNEGPTLVYHDRHYCRVAVAN